MSRTRPLVPAVIVPALVAGVLAAPAPDGPWRLDPPVAPTTATGYLTAVSCSTPTACIAVGYAENLTGDILPLAEQGAGTRWDLAPTANPAGSGKAVLNGVSCTPSGACMAVGFADDRAGAAHILAERWTGTRWELIPTPKLPDVADSGLYAVSCSAANSCVAVGSETRSDGTAGALAELWNGTRWTRQTTADPAGATAVQLSGVSCAGPAECAATGSYQPATGGQLPLVESENATGWRIEATPDPAGAIAANLLSVSCAAEGACVTGGYYVTDRGTTIALALVRNPATSTWTRTAAPQDARRAIFDGIVCTSTNACTAVGTAPSGALAERWDGSAWTAQSAGTARRAGFSGVACAGAGFCAAVGWAEPTGNYSRVLVDTWNGAAWQVRAAANAYGATDATLLGVSCAAATACFAVGYTLTPQGRQLTLAERSSPAGGWAISHLPSSTAPSSQLEGVSCSTASACIAVGFEYTDAGDRPLAEYWDGETWTRTGMPLPSQTAQGIEPRAVSCSAATACTAVGTYSDSTGTDFAFAERWNGIRWTLQSVPAPHGATGTQLEAVSCASATACVAVGGATNAEYNAHPLIESWDGTVWQLQTAALPAHGSDAQLLGVSCAAPLQCTAVGNYVFRRRDQVSLAETGTGGVWQVQPTPDGPGAVVTVLNAVSCGSSTACTAVGFYNDLGSGGHLGPIAAFSAELTDSGWTSRPVPSTAGTTSTDLEAVSCPSGCTAAGYRVGASQRQVPFAVTARAAGGSR